MKPFSICWNSLPVILSLAVCWQAGSDARSLPCASGRGAAGAQTGTRPARGDVLYLHVRACQVPPKQHIWHMETQHHFTGNAFAFVTLTEVLGIFIFTKPRRVQVF